MWRINPQRNAETAVPVLAFLQFTPGQYRFAALVHVWTDPPGQGGNTDLSQSQVIVADARFAMQLPISILIIGATIGGLLAFILRWITHRVADNAKIHVSMDGHAALGLAGTLIVAIVGTILLSRVGAASGFVTLTINDIWGAIATGFLLEWVGVKTLLRHIPNANDRDRTNNHEVLNRPAGRLDRSEAAESAVK
jgi:hypothetical protein